jgi:hypothetical protein
MRQVQVELRASHVPPSAGSLPSIRRRDPDGTPAKQPRADRAAAPRSGSVWISAFAQGQHDGSERQQEEYAYERGGEPDDEACAVARDEQDRDDAGQR